MRKKLLIVCLLAPMVIAATMISTAYSIRTGDDYGGGEAQGTSLKTRGSIGGAVGGETRSTSYVVYTGVRTRAADVGPVVVFENLSKETLTTNEGCSIQWHSTIDGDFYVEVGGNGTPGSGTQIDYGTCTTDLTVETYVNEFDLLDNQGNTVYIIVDNGFNTFYAAIAITDDQVLPDMSFTQITVQGSVDDATVTDVYVNSVPVSVVSGQYQALVNTSLDEIIIEATNGEGETVRRTIRVW